MNFEPSPNTRISVRNLWKVFGKRESTILQEEWAREASKTELQEKTGNVLAVRDVSFDVTDGEIFVVMGLSGSGKSTLIRCLIRLVEPTMGEIFVDGEDICQYGNKRLIELRRKKLGMIFQHYGLLPHRRVLDNVAYGLEVQGISRSARYEKAAETLETVGLTGWENAYPDELSGGMQQRVGIARALALDPEILLMDEPFSGLDPLIRREMQDELLSIQAKVRKTIVFITHDLNEAMKLGDNIAILRDGLIIQRGTAEELVSSPADDYVSEFIRDVAQSRVLGAKTIMEPVESVAYGWQTPAEAVRIMERADSKFLFVQDGDGKLLGYLTLGMAAASSGNGGGSVSTFCKADCPKADPNTVIDDLVPLAAEYECPIAVVEEDGRLLGIVDQNAVLRSVARSMNRIEEVGGLEEPVRSFL